MTGRSVLDQPMYSDNELRAACAKAAAKAWEACAQLAEQCSAEYPDYWGNPAPFAAKIRADNKTLCQAEGTKKDNG